MSVLMQGTLNWLSEIDAMFNRTFKRFPTALGGFTPILVYHSPFRVLTS